LQRSRGGGFLVLPWPWRSWPWGCWRWSGACGGGAVVGWLSRPVEPYRHCVSGVRCGRRALKALNICGDIALAITAALCPVWTRKPARAALEEAVLRPSSDGEFNEAAARTQRGSGTSPGMLTTAGLGAIGSAVWPAGGAIAPQQQPGEGTRRAQKRPGQGVLGKKQRPSPRFAETPVLPPTADFALKSPSRLGSSSPSTEFQILRLVRAPRSFQSHLA